MPVEPSRHPDRDATPVITPAGPGGDQVAAPVDRYFLPSEYRSRATTAFFDDLSPEREQIVHQPDAYRLAGRLARGFDARRILDIGCGAAEKLLPLASEFEITGVDHPLTVARLDQLHPHHTWIAHDLESVPLPPDAIEGADAAVVVCCDVIEHVLDPRPLLRGLRSLWSRAEALVITTPDRQRVRGPEHQGPPDNPAHVREWSLEELDLLLRSEGLGPSFIGYTVNNDRDLQKRTIVAVIDRTLGAVEAPPQAFRVEAMLSCFNERDITPYAVTHLLQQGVDVTVIDDWSTDGSWELLKQQFGRDPRVRFVRHGTSPTTTYEWASILSMKEALANQSDADWVVHHDADELRESPWPGVSLRTAFWNVQRQGFNAVDHTVIDFRPTTASAALEDPSIGFHHFEWGRRPGHFQQVRAWRNQHCASGLAESGGHRVEFAGCRVAPYKFLLRHYPLRTAAQARQKVFEDRVRRFSADERARGWHVQYDQFDADHEFVWDPSMLEPWYPETFHREYLVERISGIGIVR